MQQLTRFNTAYYYHTKWSKYKFLQQYYLWLHISDELFLQISLCSLQTLPSLYVVFVLVWDMCTASKHCGMVV